MPTVIQQGAGLTLTINSVAFDPQTSNTVLTWENTVETYPTLNGNIAVVTDTTGSLTFTAYQDFKTSPAGLADGLWTAAATGTAITCSLAIASGPTFTFSAVPQFPAVGGDANGALEYTCELVINGTVTKT